MISIKKFFKFLPAMCLAILSGLSAVLFEDHNLKPTYAANEYLITSYRQQSQFTYTSYNGTTIIVFFDGTLNILQDTTSGKYFYRYNYSFTLNDGSHLLDKFYSTYNGNSRQLTTVSPTSSYFDSLPTQTTFNVICYGINPCYDDDDYNQSWWQGHTYLRVNDGVRTVTLNSTFYSYLYPYYTHGGDVAEDTLADNNDLNVSILRYDYSYNVDDYQNGYNAGYNVGYNDGYNAGNNAGYDSGYQAGVESQQTAISDAYNDGYSNGYNEGFSADTTATTIFSGILQVGMLPVNVLLAIFNFEILGINLSAFVSAILTVCLTVIVIRNIKGGSD